MSTENITFGNCKIIEKISQGGMAAVYKATISGASGFEKPVAIKTILENYSENKEFLNMFIQEAKLACQLSHPNIVQILELAQMENTYYMALEYIQGKDLRSVLKQCEKKNCKIPIHLSAYIITKICAALDYAHRKCFPDGNPMNIVHRDVSPPNILISYEGSVKLTDFGIAKAAHQLSDTQAGVLKGKANYLSPE